MLIQIVRTHTHPHTQWTSSTSHRHLKRITQKFRIRNGRRVERRSTKFVPFQNNKTFHRAHWVKNRFCQHSKTNVIRFQIVSCQVREQKGDGEKKKYEQLCRKTNKNPTSPAFAVPFVRKNRQYFFDRTLKKIDLQPNSEVMEGNHFFPSLAHEV